MDDGELRTLFADLPPQVRDVLRRAARKDQSERDVLTHRLERNSDGVGMAEIVDRMSLNQALRQQVVRVLGELEATG